MKLLLTNILFVEESLFLACSHNSAFTSYRSRGRSYACFCVYSKFLRTLLANRADRLPVVTVAAVPIYAVRIEAHVVSVVAVVRAERTRPVVAATARTVETAIAAIARSRKKNGFTVLFTCYFISFYSVLSSPRPGTV